MSNERTRVLLVEDDKSHASLVCRAFEPLADEFELTAAVTLADARVRLEESSFHLVIADLRLPDGKGTALLSDNADPQSIPQVVVTSAGNEQEAVEAMKAGAMDYVVKSAENFADMPHLARRTLREWKHRAEQRQAEERLRMLSSFVEQSSEGMAVVNLAGNLLFVNESFAAMHGYVPDELPGKHLSIFHTPQQMPRVDEANRQILETGGFSGEIWHTRRDGSVFPSLMQNCVLRDESGNVVGMIATLRDITERKQAEEELRKARDELELRVEERTAELSAANAALREEIAERKRAEEARLQSEIRFQGLFDNLPDFVVVVDREAKILFANGRSHAPDPEKLPGTLGFSYIAPEDAGKCREAFEQAFATGEVQSTQCKTIFDQWLDCRVVPLTEEGTAPAAMIICTDISDRRESQEALERERNFLRQLLDLHEQERQVLAYEIHDGFAQQLTGTLFQLQGFRQQQTKNPQAAQKAYEVGLSSLRGAIDETRRLINGLRPPILDEAGIVAAIDYMICEASEQFGLDVEFVRDLQVNRLAPPLETTVFRIVQESLTNVRHHSGSQKAKVSLTGHDDQLNLEIKDWGCGFNPEEVDESHFGLRGIRERARLLGGKATVDTALGHGTRIVVELPLLERFSSDPPTNGSISPVEDGWPPPHPLP